ncbi:unnamed protein product [Malus baccata var. baccata]
MSLMDSMVNEERYFLRSTPQTKLKHARRETNKVAHRLAQLGLTLEQQRVWFEESLDVITDLG